MKTFLSLIFLLVLLNSQGFAGGYVDNGDGTVTNWRKGLMWQQCSWGQSGSDCSVDTATETNWSSALDYCENQIGSSGTFAGYSDWKLPDIKELTSLVDYDQSSPFIDPLFPNTPNTMSISVYWSASSRVNYPSTAWWVNFDDGRVLSSVKTNGRYVRCIRSGQ